MVQPEQGVGLNWDLCAIDQNEPEEGTGTGIPPEFFMGGQGRMLQIKAQGGTAVLSLIIIHLPDAALVVLLPWHSAPR